MFDQWEEGFIAGLLMGLRVVQVFGMEWSDVEVAPPVSVLSSVLSMDSWGVGALT